MLPPTSGVSSRGLLGCEAVWSCGRKPTFRSPCFLQLQVFRVEVFWVVAQYSAVVGYRRFGGPCCLQLQVFQVEVFWVVKAYNVVGYQRFGGPCCLQLQVFRVEVFWTVKTYTVVLGYQSLNLHHREILISRLILRLSNVAV
jgi:hypothetical protein